MADFARGFCLTLPDGTTLDGAQFPNGMVVTCHREEGLRTAAISVEHLLEGADPDSIRIQWAPEIEEN